MSDRDTAERLGELVYEAGLGANEAARFLGVDPRAVRRWLDARDNPPDSILMLLSILEAYHIQPRRARELAGLAPFS